MRTATVLVLLAVVAGCAEKHRPQLDPAKAIPDQSKLDSLNLRPQTDHYVSNPDFQLRKGEAVPDFSLPDTEGAPVSLSQVGQSKPVLVFFVEKDCPCCVGAKPFLERVRSKYEDVLATVAVIDTDTLHAKKWSQAVTALFPVLVDPDQTVVTRLKAERGAYTMLVDKGKVVRAYPGYSRAMLEDLGNAVAESAKVSVRPIDTSGAPEKMVTGCAFPQPSKP